VNVIFLFADKKGEVYTVELAQVALFSYRSPMA